MESLGYSRKRLAAALRRTPEHVRKLVEGEAFPGPDLQDSIAEVLELNPDEFREAVENDRWFKKTGRKPPLPEKPRVPAIDRVWPKLTPEQREMLTCVATCLAKTTR